MSLWSEVSSRNHGGVSSQNHGGVSNSKLPSVRICKTVCTDRHDDHDNDAIQNCRISGSVEPFANIEAARPHDAVDDAFIKTPELQDINRLFAHIDFEHQRLRKINDLETSICEHVIGILDTPLPGV